MLAHYLNADASAIVFSYGKYGKPGLSNPLSDLCFNLSHSGGVAVFVFGRRCRLGVDIEREREIAEQLQIATRFFAPEEIQDLRTTSGAEQRRLFFHCWARKEAYIKAAGGALSIALNSFRVRFLPDDAPAVETPDPSQRWLMYELNIAPGFAAALVHDGEPRSIHVNPWLDIGDALRSWGGPHDRLPRV